MIQRRYWALMALACSAAVLLTAGDRQPPELNNIPNGVVWYGILQDGLDEARETGKPILLLSAAPNCAGVSGIW